MKLACPNCESADFAKHGKDASGKQKFRCRACGRQFLGGSKFRLDSKTKNIINNLLLAGVHPQKIVLAIPEVSLRWVYRLRKNMQKRDSEIVSKGKHKKDCPTPRGRK